MIYQGFVGPSYRSQSLNLDAEELINMYVEQMESPFAKAKYALYSCPGYQQFCTAAQGPIRGMFSQDGRMFEVIGFVFYEIASDGTMTNWGPVAADANPATISSSGDAGGELFITSGGEGYIFDLNANTLSSSVVSDVTMGAYLEGFFLALDTKTSTLRISNLLDGTTWDSSQVALRLQGSDRWVSMFVVNAEIWLIGSQTTEVWYNAGTAPFPFAPLSNAFLTQGTPAAFSPAPLGTSLAWLSQNSQGSRMVVVNNGFTPQRISNHAVEFAIQSYATVADAVGFSYQDQGHEFYVLTFPTAGVTWVFDAATQMWHKRGFWNAARNVFEALRVMFHCYAFNKHLFGDRVNGATYEGSINFYTDVDGQGLRRLRQAPIVSNENLRIFTGTLVFDVETGVGTQTGAGSDPQLSMQKSSDSGHTFGSERLRSLGKAGEYSVRVRFTRTGSGRNTVFRAVVSDPVPWRVAGAFFEDIVGGNS